MPRVITFSTVFPKGHIRSGEKTYFVEKIQSSMNLFGLENQFFPKRHTIRASRSFKVGDKFSPRYWSGKPYHSPQISICDDLEVKAVYDIDIYPTNEIMINGRFFATIDSEKFTVLANNDGLRPAELKSWFSSLPFHGQIVCWNDFINY